MSKRNLIVWLVMGLCWMVLPAKASGLGDIRVHARFLTDRMAFELNLNQYQYDDLYEVNFDFLCGIDPYINDLAYSRAAAMDAYYRYLDERNDDLRWILSSAFHGLGLFLPADLCGKPLLLPACISDLSEPDFLLFRSSPALLDVSGRTQSVPLRWKKLLPGTLRPTLHSCRIWWIFPCPSGFQET